MTWREFLQVFPPASRSAYLLPVSPPSAAHQRAPRLPQPARARVLLHAGGCGVRLGAGKSGSPPATPTSASLTCCPAPPCVTTLLSNPSGLPYAPYPMPDLRLWQLRPQGAPPPAAAPHRRLPQDRLAALQPLQLQEPAQARRGEGEPCGRAGWQLGGLLGTRDARAPSRRGGRPAGTAGSSPPANHNRATFPNPAAAGCTAARSWMRCWMGTRGGSRSCCGSCSRPSEK